MSGKQAKYLVPFLPRVRAALPAARWRKRLRRRAGGKCCRRRSAFSSCPRFSSICARGRPAMSLPAWAAEIPLWPIAVPGCLRRRSCCSSPARESRSRCARLPSRCWRRLRSLAPASFLRSFVQRSPGPAARHLATLQDEKVPLAHLGKYHAQYNFAGRLPEPIAILDLQEVKGWVAAHPAGQVLTVERSRYAGAGKGPEYEAPFRGAWFQACAARRYSWRGPTCARLAACTCISPFRGGLVGLGIAIFLYVFEYMAVKSAAAARGKKMAKKVEINQETLPVEGGAGALLRPCRSVARSAPGWSGARLAVPLTGGQAACFSARALSVASQVNSGSSRPKCP